MIPAPPACVYCAQNFGLDLNNPQQAKAPALI